MSGFLGCGKTTLLQRIIRSSAPTARVGVIVNDLAAVNIDAELLRGTTVATATAVDVDAGLLRGGAVTAATASDTVAVAVLPEAVAVADGVDGGQGPMDVGSLIPGLPSKKPRMEGPPVGGGSSSSNAHAPAVGGSSSSHARAPAGGGTSSSHARAPPAPAHIVELSNGCICCTLRGELVLEVARLLATAAAAGQAGQGGGPLGGAGRQPLDIIVVESTGVGEPLPIAVALCAQDAAGNSLQVCGGGVRLGTHVPLNPIPCLYPYSLPRWP